MKELIKNFKIIFDRWRSYNLTFIPEKHRLGMSKVEYKLIRLWFYTLI